MNKKDILELKRRFKKDECTFTRMCGCYVDGVKNIVLNFKKNFLNLEEEEYFKYLEIAKKTLSGTIGNNLLELNFPLEEDNLSSKQHFLMKLKKSKLKDDALLDEFYKLMIDSYDYTGNFLIIIFHDAYDVITKTTDNGKLDESEEVYEYILCAICPVSLSKAGLGYFEDDNRIGARIRDWVVETPNLGFVFPAFTDRSTDVNSIMYYAKNAKDPHPELMERGLGCASKQTATEQKEVFTNILRHAIGPDDKKCDELIMDIQENLNNMIDEHNTVNDNSGDPIVLTNDVIQNILIESEVPEEITAKIEKSYIENFSDTPPLAETLIDTKVLAASAQKKKEAILEKQVEILQNKLEKTKVAVSLDLEAEGAINLDTTTSPEESTINSDLDVEGDTTNTPSYDIVLQVKPEKVSQIKSQIIDGQKCIIIPIDDNEQTNVNGIETLV